MHPPGSTGAGLGSGRQDPGQISDYNLMSWQPEELPADLREFVTSEHPDLAADAVAVLAAEPHGAS